MRHILPAVGRHGYPAARILAAAGEQGHALYRDAGGHTMVLCDRVTLAYDSDGGHAGHVLSPEKTALRCAYSLSLATNGRARITVARP